MVGSTPQPPLWLIRNPSSGLWGKSNVRIQFIFSEKTSDEDLFGRRRRRLDQKKFQFLKHNIQGGMLIQERAPKHVLLCDTRVGNLPII